MDDVTNRCNEYTNEVMFFVWLFGYKFIPKKEFNKLPKNEQEEYIKEYRIYCKEHNIIPKQCMSDNPITGYLNEYNMPTIPKFTKMPYNVKTNRVSIIPTAETSYGIDDKYYIKDINGNILHENIKQDNLIDIILSNNYSIISGEGYV